MHQEVTLNRGSVRVAPARCPQHTRLTEAPAKEPFGTKTEENAVFPSHFERFECPVEVRALISRAVPGALGRDGGLELLAAPHGCLRGERRGRVPRTR